MTPIQTIAANIARDTLKELKEHPQRWQKGANACDAGKMGVYPKDPRAVCWCLRGHIIRRLPDHEGARYVPSAFISSVEDVFRGVGDIWSGIPHWNDDPSRTVADVIALCERVATAQRHGEGDAEPCPQCHEAGEHKEGCELS